MFAILQIEDDPNDVFFLQRAFRKAGITNPMQVSEDGQQAIDYLQGVGQFADREKYPMPSLVLLDLKLPNVMGLEVLRWIRQQSGLDLIVLILTSSAEEADITTAYRLGANAYLIKPFETAEREAMAKAIKDFWLTHNRAPTITFAESPMEGVAPVFSRTTSPSTTGVEKALQSKFPFSF